MPRTANRKVKPLLAPELLTPAEAAAILGVSAKTLHRWDSDNDPARAFPQPVQLPSPAGGNPLVRFRLTDIRKFGGLE
jgi:predicted DNA-binding transcriptional regulator AlpA